MRFRLLVTAFALLCSATPLAAQITVVPVSNLRFGVLTPGLPTHVAPTDAASRAELQVTGRGRMTLVVVLPTSATAASGQAIPLQYGANDGQYRIGTQQLRAFDPRSPLTVTIPASAGSLQLFVGGTAVPVSNQAPGNYIATLTVQAFQ